MPFALICHPAQLLHTFPLLFLLFSCTNLRMMSSLPRRHSIVDFNSYPIRSSICSFLVSGYLHSDSVPFAISMALFIMIGFPNLHSAFLLHQSDSNSISGDRFPSNLAGIWFILHFVELLGTKCPNIVRDHLASYIMGVGMEKRNCAKLILDGIIDGIHKMQTKGGATPYTYFYAPLLEAWLYYRINTPEVTPSFHEDPNISFFPLISSNVEVNRCRFSLECKSQEILAVKMGKLSLPMKSHQAKLHSSIYVSILELYVKSVMEYANEVGLVEETEEQILDLMRKKLLVDNELADDKNWFEQKEEVDNKAGMMKLGHMIYSKF